MMDGCAMDSDLVQVEDPQVMEAVVVAAAITGDPAARQMLPTLPPMLEEPYRTVAARVNEQVVAGGYVDEHTVGMLLGSSRLVRRNASGMLEQLSVEQVLALVLAEPVKPGQVAAYLQVLKDRYAAKQQVEFEGRVVEAAKSLAGQPGKLVEELQQLAATAGPGIVGASSKHPAELLELIPYVQRLVNQQTGGAYLGLNSGFEHVNNLCNGLDTGLLVLAAPPGAGKTTLCWQIACQAAQRNPVPAVFVSLEQSKDELRAKVIARLADLEYRHILRGRFRSDNPQDVQKLLNGAKQYLGFAQRVTVIEGDATTTLDQIQAAAASAMQKVGASRCLVVVDYLQILPMGVEGKIGSTSTKDRVDLQVSALRRLARDLDSPVLAISSENRAGYGSKSLNVFKESGGIEYSADVAMVLKPDKSTEPASGAAYRPMCLHVIKNRNGERGVVHFKFYPKSAKFVETGKGEYVAEDGLE